MNINGLKIDNAVFGNKFILTDIKPYKSYKDGAAGEVEGYRYEVALPALGLEKVSVKIAGRQLLDMPKEDFPLVRFSNLYAKIYVVNGNAGVSITADGINVVKAN